MDFISILSIFVLARQYDAGGYNGPNGVFATVTGALGAFGGSLLTEGQQASSDDISSADAQDTTSTDASTSISASASSSSSDGTTGTTTGTTTGATTGTNE